MLIEKSPNFFSNVIRPVGIGKYSLLFFQLPALYMPGKSTTGSGPKDSGQGEYRMTTQVSAQPNLNGFEALPRNEKQWFLDRLQSRLCAPASGRMTASRRPVL